MVRLASGVLLVLLAAVLAPPRAGAQEGGDPRAAAFGALQAASAAPITGNSAAGAVRQLGFSVPALPGGGPVAQAQAFLASYGAILGATGPDQVLVLRSVSGGPAGGDPAGGGTSSPLSIVSFAQRYKGVPVFGGELRIGIESSPFAGPRVTLASGTLLPDLALEGGLDVVPTISPDACIAAARSYLSRPGAETLAAPRLMLYDARLAGGAPGAHLVWKVGLGGGTPIQVFCDAHSAAIVFDVTLVHESAGTSSLDLDEYEALGHNSNISCYGFAFGRTKVGDRSGVFQGFQSLQYNTAWWHIINTYLFFHDTYGRHSWNNNNAAIDVNLGAGVPNGQYAPGCDVLEFKTNYVSFDVMVHEFTHAMIHHTSDLTYKNESGAVNESYADVMGAVADSGDWLHAEDLLDGSGPNRSLEHPPQYGQPDKFSGYLFMSADNGGVHVNSGIGNKAHYLMVTGKAFNGRPAFGGMTRDKMGRVAYMALQSLSSSGIFADARALEIWFASWYAALNFFGFTPADVCAVKNGWAAVELGPGDFDCDRIDDSFQDLDFDFLPSSLDNCPVKWNPDQKDWDKDGVGDACDVDYDNDGVPDIKDNCQFAKNWNQADNDHDGAGDACDPDDDNDGVLDGADNCPLDSNPSQYDGDGDGPGDACDPDFDGDGFYDADNCTFVHNPAQTDSDGDDLGDACDLCPLVADWNHAYLVNKWQSPTPVPYQPDSDEDGSPDACDPDAFGAASLDLNGAPYNPGHVFHPGGEPSWGSVDGPAGSQFRIPVPLCDAATEPGPGSAAQIVFSDLDPNVDVVLLDDDGLVAAALRPGPAGSNQRGLRLKPDCARGYFLGFSLGSGFDGSDDFVVQSALIDSASADPWIPPDAGLFPPPPIADADGDGLPDAVDTCPAVPDPTRQDGDGDQVGDACDNCRVFGNSDQADANVDGIGNACECGDQDGNGNVDVRDLIAINLAIFNPALATALCDTNYDARCSVSDIVRANLKMYGQPAYCSRYPPR